MQPRLLLLWCVMALVPLVSCRGGETGLHPGDFAPDFTVTNVDGGDTTLSTYRGRIVLLNFWASWCGPCIEELPSLQRLSTLMKDEGVVVLAVGIDDDIAKLREFKRQYSLTYPILFDAEGVAKPQYKLSGLPESFVLDREGKIALIPDPEDGIPVSRFIGPRQWDSEKMISSLRALTSAPKR